MYLRFIGGIALAAMLAVYIAPAPTSAAVLTDAQIQAITSLAASFGVDASVVSRIESVLKGNTVIGGGSSTSSGVTEPAHPVVPKEWRHMICKRLLEAQTFPTLGTQSTFAQDIQDFLVSEGFFKAPTTGYFGTLTREAIGKWQEEHGITTARDAAQGWGIFGPRTRAAIAQWCNGGMRFNAEPTRGVAPLLVTFSTWIGGLRGDRDSVTFYIDFGDNSPREIATECSAPTDRCESHGKNTHTYTTDGKYTATLVKVTDFCRGNQACLAPVHEEVIGKQQIHVGTTVCTQEYAPVCGAKQIVCITTPCNPVPTTYSNRCMMAIDNATFLYAGECRSDTQQPFVPHSACKAWYDGCNNCTRQSADSPAACTLRACALQLPGYCTARFDDATVTNQPPVISELSGPTTLSLKETGTWTINASDPENGSLSYSVRWGDENLFANAVSAIASTLNIVQTTTFTHAYASAGTYTVTIIVRDSAGQEAQTTATVAVINDSRFTCTQEAKLCSDGSYVGRTGPNCEFAACPTSVKPLCTQQQCIARTVDLSSVCNTASCPSGVPGASGSCKLCTAGYGGVVSNGDGTFQMACKEPETAYAEGSLYYSRCPANSACVADPGYFVCQNSQWVKATTQTAPGNSLCTTMTGIQTTSGQNICGDMYCPNNPVAQKYYCSGGGISGGTYWSATPCTGMACMAR